MKTTKKLIALFLGAVMLLGLLAGCGETASTPKESGSPAPAVPVLSGMLVLSAKASFKISYDQDGMVMELAGANEDGEAIVAEYKDFNGKSCSTVAKELIAATAEATLLREAKSIVVKLAVGSQLPSETFLESVANEVSTAATENASTAYVVTVGLDALDEEGYINAETVQALLQNELGVEKFDSYVCDLSPRNGFYTAYVTVNGDNGAYLIDAVTGLITETVDEEYYTEPEYVEEEEFDESFEEDTSDYTEETTPEEA